MTGFRLTAQGAVIDKADSKSQNAVAELQTVAEDACSISKTAVLVLPSLSAAQLKFESSPTPPPRPAPLPP